MRIACRHSQTFESGDYDASLALANDYVNTYPEDMEARYILAGKVKDLTRDG